MIARKILLSALIAAPLLAGVNSAQAQVFDLRIGTPPPPPRVIVEPAPRPGYVFVPGFWNWQGRRHVWHEGYYVRNRPGYRYVNPEWREADGGQYGFRRGHWER